MKGKFFILVAFILQCIEILIQLTFYGNLMGAVIAGIYAIIVYTLYDGVRRGKKIFVDAGIIISAIISVIVVLLGGIPLVWFLVFIGGVIARKQIK